MKRRRIWLRLALWTLGIFAVLYVLFWAFVFNPLGGSVARLDALVPNKGLAYYIEGPWGRLRQTPLLRKNFFESPLEDAVKQQFGLNEYLEKPIRQLEKQVNASVPSFLGKFSVAGDVLGKDVAIAGKLTGKGADVYQRLLNSPYVVLTRISYKMRFMDLLKYSFVRKNVPGLKLLRSFYQYDVGAGNIRAGAPESARYIYFQRIKDVLAISNSQDMMHDVVHLGTAGGVSNSSLARQYYYYYDVQTSKLDPEVTFWADPRAADSQLGGSLEGIGEKRQGSVADFTRAIFPVALTNSLMLRLGADHPETIPILGSMRLQDGSLPDRLSAVDKTEGASLADGVGRAAGITPLDGTFAFAWFSMPVKDFLMTIFDSMDTSAAKVLFGGGAQDGSSQDQEEWKRKGLASDLGEWFDDGVVISFARLPEAKNVDLDSWAGGVPKPIPGTTLVLHVKGNLDPADLPEYFDRKHKEFGFGKPVEKPAPVGKAYHVPVTVDRTLAFIDPGFAIVGHEFIFSTNFGELMRVLQTAAGKRESLSKGESFQAALKSVASTANLFAYCDMDRMRPYLLDQRWDYAFRSVYFDKSQYRTKVILNLKTNPKYSNWTEQQFEDEADRLVARRVQRMEGPDFSDAIQRYRSDMFWFSPFKWMGITTTVSSDQGGGWLQITGAIRLEPVNKR